MYIGTRDARAGRPRHEALATTERETMPLGTTFGRGTKRPPTAAVAVAVAVCAALAGLAGGAMRRTLRRWGPQVGGAVLILLGLVTTLRSVGVTL